MANEDLARSIAEDIMAEQSAAQSNEAREIAESIMSGQQAAASDLLQSDFSPGAYAPKMLRWSLARGDTMEEKRLRLKKRYPEGELKTLPESVVLGFDKDMLIWRESPQQQWKAVEPQGFDRFDIAEAIAPSAESMATEAVMAIGSGGSSIPVTVGRQALGAIFGEAAEQIMQSVTGVQDQSVAQASMEALEEGAWSAVGGFAMSPFVAATNIARGAGALKVGDEGIEVIQAAGALDKKLAAKLTPGLVTDNPAVRLSEQQSSAILPGLQRRYNTLIKIMDDAVRSSAPGNAATAMKDVVNAMQSLSDDFLRRLGRHTTTATDGGKAFKEGVEEYSERTFLHVKKLYNKARSIQEPDFDFVPVYGIADDLMANSKGPISAPVAEQINALKAIEGPVRLPSGEVLSVTDQVRNVRTELWSLKHVEPGKQPNQATGQANDLYKAVTDMLENPKNADPAFTEAWRAANKAARIRLTTLEKSPIVAAAKSENPSDLVRTYIAPGNSEYLLAIRQTLPVDKWNKFVDAAYAKIMSDPGSIEKTLRSFDQETLDVFMPRADQALWLKVGKELDRVTKAGVGEIAERQVSNRNFIDKLLRSADPRDAQMLIRAANNTNNTQMRQSLRAAIVEWSWDGVVEKTKTGLKINNNVLKDRVSMLKKSGMWRILSVEERRIISNVETVARAFQRVADAGTSIQGAEAVGGLQAFKHSAVMTFVRKGIFSNFVLSGVGRKALIGSGLPNTNGAFLRLLGGSLAQMSAPQDISEMVEDEE